MLLYGTKPILPSPLFRPPAPLTKTTTNEEDDKRRRLPSTITMDLRRIEGELEELSTIWKTLRHQRPIFGQNDGSSGNNGESLYILSSARMPQWKELLAQVAVANDDDDDDDDGDHRHDNTDIFSEDNGKMEGTGVHVDTTVANGDDTGDERKATATATATTVTALHEEESAIDYEFGMCLLGAAVTPSSTKEAENNHDGRGEKSMSMWDRYAKKEVERTTITTSSMKKLDGVTTTPGQDRMTTSSQKNVTCVEKDKDGEMDVVMEDDEDARPEDILSSLESLRGRVFAISSKIEKLRKKSKEVSAISHSFILYIRTRFIHIASFHDVLFSLIVGQRDLVTKKPRFGEKTLARVKVVIRTYAALERGVTIALDDTNAGVGLISILRSQIHQHAEKVEADMRSRISREQEEADRLAQEARRVEELEREKILLAKIKRREEEEMLAHRANEARIRRIEEERAAEDAVRAADRELLAMVPNIGPDGVREQIGRMKMALKDDANNSLPMALSSLRDMFALIVRHPEEMKYRSVRRDHPKFMENIGRHVGGREVLIAAGFRLEKIEEIPCFYSKEPDVEKDMDGWSDWFDNLKKTLDVIEKEMIK